MEADYVIVGSGSAGSALAYRLGEAGHSVLVIEFGGSDWGPFIQMPAALSYPMNMARYDWGFRTEPEPHLGGRSPRHAARQGHRRLVLDQRHGLCPRPPARTSTPGPRWAPTAGAGPTSRPTSSGWSTGTAAIRLARRRRAAARHPRPAAQPALPLVRGGRRARPASSSPTTTTARSRKASGRWSRRSGRAAAGPPPTPICGRRCSGGNVGIVRGLATRVVIDGGRATGVEVRARGQRRDRHARGAR